MGFLDNLKDKAEEFGDKAREGFEAARGKATDLAGDVRDRFDGDPDTSTEQVATAAGYSPAAVDEASRGIEDAVADSTAAESSAPEGVDPQDRIETVVPGVEPIDPAEADEDPLGPAPDRR